MRPGDVVPGGPFWESRPTEESGQVRRTCARDTRLTLMLNLQIPGVLMGRSKTLATAGGGDSGSRRTRSEARTSALTSWHVPSQPLIPHVDSVKLLLLLSSFYSISENKLSLREITQLVQAYGVCTFYPKTLWTWASGWPAQQMERTMLDLGVGSPSIGC